MKLVVVESPAKAKTIEKYLGPGYRVLASYGHVRDLPPKDGSVDPDAGFAMQWETYADKQKQLRAITDEAKGADTLILATDPDREGEAISWHVQEILRNRRVLPKDVQRVTFNAITKSAVTDAMAKPRQLDEDLIDAYRARRALDYLVGFTLSPVLWRKLPGAKSAGRVQSVSLRLIVDREREIECSSRRNIGASPRPCSTTAPSSLPACRASKAARSTASPSATKVLPSVPAPRWSPVDFTVASVETKPFTRNPPPPFTTSTLQQEAARKLGFSASHTMRVARISTKAARSPTCGPTASRWRPTRSTSPAHRSSAASARTTCPASRASTRPRPRTPGSARGDPPHRFRPRPLRLRRRRPALRTGLEARARQPDGIGPPGTHHRRIADETGAHALRATGQVVLFPGFLALYEEGRDDEAAEDERRLPKLAQGDAPDKRRVHAEQHFTQPPPRYSEASLVKRMEELGIGRPSTYAAILQTLKDRSYVRAEKNRLWPEESGRLLIAFLERFFERYVSYDFTAGLEDELDEVSGGRAEWQAVLEAFWRDFKPKTAEVMEQQPSAITAALDEFLAPFLFPTKATAPIPRLCPACGDGRWRCGEGGSAPSSPAPTTPNANIPAASRRAAAKDRRIPAAAAGRRRQRHGSVAPHRPFRRLCAAGRWREAQARLHSQGRAGRRHRSPWAVKLLSLPREVGTHPESGNPITASIGRYGPYLAHDGKYAKLGSTAEVFETGMNAAVAKLADAAAGGGRARGSREPLKVLGPHPRTELELRVMEGRFGPYVTDGTTNATLPRTWRPML
jgi:DNA topoisomerase-1